MLGYFVNSRRLNNHGNKHTVNSSYSTISSTNTNIIMAIHKDIKDRIGWFKELYQQVLDEFGGDVELARPVYKRLLFEEKCK